jgi:WD40 repeat protein
MLRRDFLRGSFAAAGLSRLFNLDSVPKPLSFLERVRPTSPTLAYPTLVPEFGQLEDYSSCIFARNDKNIVTASIGDHSAVLWETASGKQLRTFVHGSPVANIAFSPRDNRLLTFGGGSQPVANLWDLATGKKLQTFKHHRERILAGAFSDDGKRIFTASRDDSVCTWSADSTAPQHVIRGIKQIDKAAFAPNPTSLVFTTKDKKLQVLDFSEGTVFRDLPVKPTESWQTDGEEFDHPIIFSPDGSLVAVFANCWGLTIYDFKSRKCLWHTDIPIPAISSMAFTPTSKELLTITSDLHAPSLEPYDHNLMTTTLTLRDAQTGLHPSEFVLYAGDFRNAPQSSAVAISFSDDLIVSGYATGATLMRKQDASSVFQLKGNTNAINSLAINSLSTLLLVGDSTHNAFTWDFGEGAVIETFGPHEIQPLYVHFDEKDEVITDEPNFFRRWPSDRSLAPFQLDRQTPEGWLYPVRDDGGLALMFPSSFHRTDPNQILADAVTLGFLSPFSEEKVANVWSPGLPSKAFQFHFSHFGPALFAPDGHSVFALRDDQVCKLDLSLPAEVWSSPDQPVSIEQIAVSRQGDKVLTGGHDDTAGLAQLWNAENGKLIRNFVGHEGGVTSVAFYFGTCTGQSHWSSSRVITWKFPRLVSFRQVILLRPAPKTAPFVSGGFQMVTRFALLLQTHQDG